MKGSLLAPVLDLTIAVTCRGCTANSQRSNGRKRAGAGWGMGLLMEGCVIFYQSEHCGWRLPQVISWITESLSGSSWRNSSMYLFVCVRWLKKRKVATTHKTHNLLLFRHISQCYNINCALYQLGSWSQGALVTEIKPLANNRKIVILGSWSWRRILSNFTCFHSYILYSCVCEGL